MMACIDTYHNSRCSRTGIVLFANWTDSCAVREFVCERSDAPTDYLPGQFFRRELPCIVQAREAFDNAASILVIDGYVWLDRHGKKGLGAFVYDALGESISVIGVA